MRTQVSPLLRHYRRLIDPVEHARRVAAIQNIKLKGLRLTASVRR